MTQTHRPVILLMANMLKTLMARQLMLSIQPPGKLLPEVYSATPQHNRASSKEWV